MEQPNPLVFNASYRVRFVSAVGKTQDQTLTFVALVLAKAKQVQAYAANVMGKAPSQPSVLAVLV